MDEYLRHCALSRLLPNCPSNKKKVKKLFGANSSKERLVLTTLLTNKNLPMSFDDNAVLCIFCQRLLLKVHRLDQELNATINEVGLKIEQLYHACEWLIFRIVHRQCNCLFLQLPTRFSHSRLQGLCQLFLVIVGYYILLQHNHPQLQQVILLSNHAQDLAAGLHFAATTSLCTHSNTLNPDVTISNLGKLYSHHCLYALVENDITASQMDHTQRQ